MFDSYFSNSQQSQLAFTFVIIITSVLLFEFYKKNNAPIILLLLGFVSLKLFYILLDPFVHTWDEQVHAVVAKSLMTNPLKPTLMPDIFPYNIGNWTANHIWLHKQPMFLWLIAVSYKIFGVNLFALRLPSLVFSVFTLFSIYRMGILQFNKSIAFYAVLIFGSLYYLNELITGYFPTDHNDTAFLCFVTASMWGLSEHINNPESLKWKILIGVFAGMAILTKYLTGLFVFGPWLIYLLVTIKVTNFNLKYFSSLITSLSVTLSVSLPWQIYILYKFPNEAIYEYTYNSKHFTEVIEGHEGDMFYYIENFNLTIIDNFKFIFPFALIAFWMISKNRSLSIAITIGVLFVFIFFTIAKTKMPAFTLITYPYLILGLSALVHYIAEKTISFLKPLYSKAVLPVSFLTISVFLLQIEKTQASHTNWKFNVGDYNDRQFYLNWLKTAKYIKSLKLDKDYVIFNCNQMTHLSMMFYTDHFAYWSYPTPYHMRVLQQKNKKAAVINDGHLPSYCYDKNILIINPPSN